MLLPPFTFLFASFFLRAFHVIFSLRPFRRPFWLRFFSRILFFISFLTPFRLIFDTPLSYAAIAFSPSPDGRAFFAFIFFRRLFFATPLPAI